MMHSLIGPLTDQEPALSLKPDVFLLPYLDSHDQLPVLCRSRGRDAGQALAAGEALADREEAAGARAGDRFRKQGVLDLLVHLLVRRGRVGCAWPVRGGRSKLLLLLHHK